MPTQTKQFAQALQHHAPDFGVELSPGAIQKLTDFYALLLKWNPRLHLVSRCSPREFATRHVLESLMLLKHLPPNARVADIGSGGGLPIVPCLLVRDDLHATLIESSARKGVFLREALRAATPPDRAQLNPARFEDIATPEADFVTCRALDRFSEVLPALIDWVPGNATLLFFAGESICHEVQTILRSVTVERIPHSERRFLLVARASCA